MSSRLGRNPFDKKNPSKAVDFIKQSEEPIKTTTPQNVDHVLGQYANSSWWT